MLVYLNHGGKHTNKYCENPIKLICDLLKRQHKHLPEKNMLLFGCAQAMKIEVAHLKSDQETVMRNDLLCAVSDLSYDTYKKYKHYHTIAFREYHKIVHTSENTGIREVHICSLLNPDTPHQVFGKNLGRCTCKDRVLDECHAQ